MVKVAVQKPPKPYVTFPLFAHSKGYWCKKIEQRQMGFGKWEWPDQDAYEKSWREALKRYQKFDEQLALGKIFSANPKKLTMEHLVNVFLTFKHRQCESGEISAKMFNEYSLACRHFRDAVGRTMTTPDLEQSAEVIQKYVFDIDEAFGWYAFNKRMTLIRGMFKWAADPLGGDLLDRPFRLAGLLKKKGEKALRKLKRLHAAEHGKPIVPMYELKVMIEHARQPLKAMLLLAYFCAYGNTDCACLPRNAINRKPPRRLGLPDGWAMVHFPRPKTEIDRAAIIPPMVLASIDEAMDLRDECKIPLGKLAHLVFVTQAGHPFVRDRIEKDDEGQIQSVSHIDSITNMYYQLRKSLSGCGCGKAYAKIEPDKAFCLHCRKPLVALRSMRFYDLRHTAITRASGATDMDALCLWEGHAISGIRRQYIEEIDTHKLLAIAQQLLQRFETDDTNSDESPISEKS